MDRLAAQDDSVGFESLFKALKNVHGLQLLNET